MTMCTQFFAWTTALAFRRTCAPQRLSKLSKRSRSGAPNRRGTAAGSHSDFTTKYFSACIDGSCGGSGVERAPRWANATAIALRRAERARLLAIARCSEDIEPLFLPIELRPALRWAL